MVRVFVRYDLPDENGETRRARNERMLDNDVSIEPTPEYYIPDGGETYWQWYFDISNGMRRIFDGCCSPIPWSELREWAATCCVEVTAAEYAVLRSMDVAFCDEMNKELQAYQDRERNKFKDAAKQ